MAGQIFTHPMRNTLVENILSVIELMGKSGGSSNLEFTSTFLPLSNLAA